MGRTCYWEDCSRFHLGPYLTTHCDRHRLLDTQHSVQKIQSFCWCHPKSLLKSSACGLNRTVETLYRWQPAFLSSNIRAPVLGCLLRSWRRPTADHLNKLSL